MNEVLETIRSRRSIRSYKSDPVPRELIEQVLEAGMYAPTGKGMQSPIILAVTDKAVRDKLSAMNAKIMGSDSDWPVVKGACAQLKALDIPFEAHILSAHRTPAEAAEFAKNARANGFGVILCAAGMAAHLAGAFAANTTLPVIGIPMKGGAMDGLDALLATVQMPSGIPVATVALNGAKNAAWLAAEILALGDEALAAKLDAERVAMARQIAAKEEKLQKEIEEL